MMGSQADNSFKGIVFDMDGTLVNSEPLHLEAWKQALARHRLYYDDEWYHQWIGISDVDMSRHIVTKNSLDIGSATFLNEKRELFRAFANEKLKAFDGVTEGLRKIRDTKMGVATSSPGQDALMSLKKTGIQPFFKTIVTADDVENFKPDPEPYLKAAIGLNVASNECAAIEDSVSGLLSARAAGMFTIGVANGNEQNTSHLSLADVVFDTTAEAINFLAEQKLEYNG